MLRKIFLLLVTLVFTGTLISIIIISQRNLPAHPGYSDLPGSMSKQIRTAARYARVKYDAPKIASLGMIYHSNTFYREAEQCYIMALSKDSSDWRWYFYLGYLYSELGDLDKAIEYLKKAVKINPSADYALYHLADAYAGKGKHAEAEKIFGSIGNSDNKPLENRIKSSLFPLSVYAKFRHARIHILQSENDEAISLLLNLTEDYPDFGPAFRLLSTVYQEQGNESLSQENIIRAAELIPFTSPVDTLIDHLAMISCSPVFVMKQMDITSVSNPLFAKQLFDNAWPRMTGNKMLLSKGIRICLNTGATENLTEYVNLHLSLFKDDAGELFDVGSVAFQRGMYKLASVYFENSLNTDPGNYLASLRLSLCYMRIDKIRQSIENLDRLFKDNPDSLKILNAKVSAFLISGDKKKAMDVISELEKINPGNPDLSYLKGKIAILNGDKNMADELFLKAYSGMPAEMEVIEYLGRLYSSSGKWEKTLELYINGLSVLPYEPFLLERTGDLFLNCPEVRLRNPEMARYYLERAFYSMKSGVNIKYFAGKNLVKAYAGRNKMDKASDVMNMVFYIAKSSSLGDKEVETLKNLYNSIFMTEGKVTE